MPLFLGLSSAMLLVTVVKSKRIIHRCWKLFSNVVAQMKEEKPFVFWQLVYIKVAACQKINFGVFFDIHEN